MSPSPPPLFADAMLGALARMGVEPAPEVRA